MRTQRRYLTLFFLLQVLMYMGGYLSGGYGGQLSWPIENYGGMEIQRFWRSCKHGKYFTKEFPMENRIELFYGP